jgi:hypothetical protein
MADYYTSQRTHHAASPELRRRLKDQYDEAREAGARIQYLLDLCEPGFALTQNLEWHSEMGEIMEKLRVIYRYNNEITKDGGEARGGSGPLFYKEIYMRRIKLQEYIKKIIMGVYQHISPKLSDSAVKKKFEEAVAPLDATPLSSAGWVDGQERAQTFLAPSASGVPNVVRQMGYNPETGDLYGGSRKKKRKSKKRKSKKRKSRRGRRTRRTRRTRRR